MVQVLVKAIKWRECTEGEVEMLGSMPVMELELSEEGFQRKGGEEGVI